MGVHRHVMKHVGTNIFKRVRDWALATLAIAGGFFVLARPAFAATSDSLTVTFRPLDTTPPAAITNLNAAPGAAGQVILQWSSPDENNNQFSDRNPVASYVVRIATFSADSIGSTTTWWNTAQDVTGEPPPSNPGVTEFMLLNGLPGGVTYYFAIKSIDDANLLSPIDTHSSTIGQQARAFVSSTLNSPPTNFAGMAISTHAIQWSWGVTLGATYYRLSTYPGDLTVTDSNGFSFDEFGFTPNEAITRILRSGNASGVSLPTSPVTVYTLANVPANLAASGITISQVSLTWTSNNNPGGTRYRLERSNNNVAYTPIATINVVTYLDTGLAQLTTYYYRVRAINEDGLLSNPSSVVTVFTAQSGDLVAPSAPAGLKGFLDPTGRAFALTWEPVRYNVDGSPATDIAGYYIYRRDSLTGPGIRLTPAPLAVAAFADQVNNQVNYYTIRAVDLAGNESPDSLIADSSPEANIIYLSTDGVSHVMMPETVNDLLRSAYNKYGVPLTIELSDEPLSADGLIVRNVRLKLIRTDTREVLNDLAFSQPQATVAVGYNQQNGQVIGGAPGIGSRGGNVRASAITPDQLSMYWFNGVTWVRIGGTVDIPAQAVKTRSSFLGNYQLRVSANPSTLSLSQGNVYPRLFTPNGDGLNDRVYFILENPNNVPVSGEIFDKDGRHVRTLPPADSHSGIGTTLIWDGKDDRGNVVPGGAYIYRISGEGKSFTGTVGVAR